MAIRLTENDPFPSQPRCHCGCPLSAHVSIVHQDGNSDTGHCVLCPCQRFSLDAECDGDCCDDQRECLLTHCAKLAQTAHTQRKVNEIWPRLPRTIQERVKRDG